MKRAQASTGWLLRTVRDPNFWLVVAMLALGALLHYGSHIWLIALGSGRLPLGLTRHTMERILFLLPITYAGFVFGPLKGFLTLLVAAGIMLPRAIFISPVPADALLETGAVLVVGVLVVLWFESLEREKERRAQALARLEAAQQQLQSHIQIIERDRKQLGALNAISAIVSQSLDLETVLDRSLDGVMEVMQGDAALVFLLQEETQELVLAAHKGVSDEFVRSVDRMKLGEGFTGRVAQSGEVMVVTDASQDPRLTRAAVRNEKLQGQLIVPLKAKNRILGTLAIAMRRPREFTLDEIQLLGHIANHIGVAVENAGLYRDAQTMQENLRFYVQQVTRAQEEERKRIARELHDETTQELVVLSRQLDAFTDGSENLSRDVVQHLNKWRDRIDNVIRGVRRFSQDLRPSVLDDLGLVAALEFIARDLTERHGIATVVEVAGESQRLPPEKELLLFRIAQEALRNVWRHSQASRAWVTVGFGQNKTKVIVRDDGRGFQLPARVGDLPGTGRLGLVGMYERARLLGGTIEVQSELGKGTSVVVEVPNSQPAA